MRLTREGHSRSTGPDARSVQNRHAGPFVAEGSGDIFVVHLSEVS